MLHTVKLAAPDCLQVRATPERRAVLIDPLVLRGGARKSDAEVLVECGEQGGRRKLATRAGREGVSIGGRSAGRGPARIQVRHARTRGLRLVAAGTEPFAFRRSLLHRGGDRGGRFSTIFFSPRTEPPRPLKRRAKRASHVKDLGSDVH